MPSIYDTRIAHILSGHTNKLARRDDDNGGLQTSTKIGIAIGLICFVTILSSFWFIWRWRTKRPPPTEEDEFRAESLDRWIQNMTRPTATNRVYREPEQMRRTSNSTFATLSTRGPSFHADEYELSQPPQAHTKPQL